MCQESSVEKNEMSLCFRSRLNDTLCDWRCPHSDFSLGPRAPFTWNAQGTVSGIRKTFKMALEVSIGFYKAKGIYQLRYFLFVIGNLPQSDLSNKTTCSCNENVLIEKLGRSFNLDSSFSLCCLWIHFGCR